MRRLLWVVALWAQAVPALAEQSFFALCFHEVREGAQAEADLFALPVDTLVAQFSWMREHGYQPVRIDDLLAARDGRKGLPPKPVLLTFDDGYASVYTRIYPLLKAFRYPALVAVVGSWLKASPHGQVRYGDNWVPRSRFLTWDQMREMQSSGLVEFASHTYDLHKGVLGNPQGNLLPAVIARIFDPKTQRYETEAQYRRRIREDLRANSELVERELGRRPRVMVWPYGRHSQQALAIAATEGMSISFTLEDDAPPQVSGLEAAGRFLLEDTPVTEVVGRFLKPRARKLRVAQVDLDYLYDPDPRQREENLGLLLDRVKAMQISTVFLQAFADPDGDGTASALYFPNRHLPVRADLFNRVAWQLHTRAGVSVYAWMPVLAFDLKQPQDDLTVKTEGEPEMGGYRRLSPFNSKARAIIGEIYEDLAAHAVFDGILFHDDAYLTDFEDASPAALAYYRRQGLPGSVAQIRTDPKTLPRWSRLKTRALIDLTQELAERVRTYHPQLKTARNLYARVVQEPQSEAWYAQSLPDFVASYDFVALMAMPYMEGSDAPMDWLERLLERVAATPQALDKTIFELQSRNWRDGRDIPTAVLVEQMERLLHQGARHIGYYPEDFIRGHPVLPSFQRGISLNDYPITP